MTAPERADARAALALARLLARGQTVAAAESLTGGLVSAALTEAPGASAVVTGGVVAYAPEVKVRLLGVPERLLRRHGTVSQECAEAMAHGVRERLRTDWGLSTTGVAGPEPVEGRPVGTVHIAVAGEQQTHHRLLNLHGTREEIRVQTVTALLDLLTDTLDARLSSARGTVGRHRRDIRRDELDEEG